MRLPGGRGEPGARRERRVAEEARRVEIVAGHVFPPSGPAQGRMVAVGQ